jgi:hypothetical protein
MTLKSLKYIKQFDIKNYTHFKESTLNLNVNDELIKPEIVEKLQTEHNTKIKKHIENIKKLTKKALNKVDLKQARLKVFPGSMLIINGRLNYKIIINNISLVILITKLMQQEHITIMRCF